MSISTEPKILVCTGRNVLLPEEDALGPATIRIDIRSGKIIGIAREYQLNGANNEHEILWIDAGDKFVLPGLVECVSIIKD